MTLRDEIDAYLARHEEDGHSPRTLEAGQLALLKLFLPWAEEAGIESLDELDDRKLMLYRVYLSKKPSKNDPGRPIAKASVKAYLRVVRTMVNFHGLGLTVKMPKVGKQEKTVISREEQQKLEDACRCDRDRLMVWLMGRRGVRATEVTLIKEQDIFEIGKRRRVVRIHGKGAGGQGELRLVPVTPGVSRGLGRLVEQGDGSEYVFHSLRAPYGPLGIRGVQSVVKAIAQHARVIKDGQPVSPHDLRHSVITYWYVDKGYSLGRIKEIAGNHNALDNYIHLRQDPAALADLDWD